MAENHVLEIRHLSKSFGKHVVLRDIDFTVDTGDVTCIIGASGSGKSTLLRCVNMLETPTTGEILYHEKDITDKGVNVPAYRSKVGMVFQSFNLFNNLTVLENCMIGQTKVLKRSKEEAKKNAMKYLEKSRYGTVHQRKAEADLRRTEAACGHRPCSGYGAGGAAVR